MIYNMDKLYINSLEYINVSSKYLNKYDIILNYEFYEFYKLYYRWVFRFNITVMSKRARGCGGVLSRIRVGGYLLPLTLILSDHFRENSGNFLGNG